VTAEIIVLALLTAVRPTSLAAVYALLSAEGPRRLMVVYLASGLAFTIAIGFLVVLAFDGIDLHSGSSRTKGVAQLAGGIIVLAGIYVVNRAEVRKGESGELFVSQRRHRVHLRRPVGRDQAGGNRDGD